MIDFLFGEELLYTLIIVLGAIISISISKKVIIKLLNFKKVNKKKQDTLKGFIINIVRYLIITIALLMILEVFGIDTAAIIASLGVVGIIAGLAVKDLLQDFVSGSGIILDDTYHVGDWVTINNFKGEVIELGMRNTKIKSYTGDVLIINNGSITSIINHSVSNINVIIDVSISYDEDNKKVLTVLTDFCTKYKDKVKNLTGDFSFLGLEYYDDSFLVYRIVLEVLNGTQFEVKREMLKLLKEELDKNGIKIPYKQLVISHE